MKLFLVIWHCGEEMKQKSKGKGHVKYCKASTVEIDKTIFLLAKS